jgi:2-polyprenyl-3-methyl-5-hydroxy-6-metoxy-1,4-benzoquinol methylase
LKDFWNARYKEETYAYGIKPNAFFKKQLDKLSVGKILLPAEGEGRNAVYAAQKGCDVTAFDYSEEARNKTMKLAQKYGVSIKYEVLNVAEFSAENCQFDIIGLFFAHFPKSLRIPFHQKIIQSLKPSGLIIFEAFHKNQLNYSSGGPKDLDMLFSAEELEKEFEGLKIQKLEDKIIELNEGLYHQGKGHVVRMIATKEKSQ